MLLRLEQNLDRLPADKAPGGQGWYGGGLVVIVRRLESVLAAKDLPDEGYGLVWGIHEESWVAKGGDGSAKTVCEAAQHVARTSAPCRRWGDGGWGMLTVIVAADGLVEGGKFGGAQGLVLLVANVVDLQRTNKAGVVSGGCRLARGNKTLR